MPQKIVQDAIYRNLKTGGFYRVIRVALDVTENKNTAMVIYKLNKWTPERPEFFIRSVTEFKLKFEEVRNEAI